MTELVYLSLGRVKEATIFANNPVLEPLYNSWKAVVNNKALVGQVTVQKPIIVPKKAVIFLEKMKNNSCVLKSVTDGYCNVRIFIST